MVESNNEPYGYTRDLEAVCPLNQGILTIEYFEVMLSFFNTVSQRVQLKKYRRFSYL